MPKSLAQTYAERILEILLGTDGEEVDSRLRDSDQGPAVFMATLRYPDDSRLAVRLIMDFYLGRRTWRVYSFHYMTRERVCIFRYDNSRYHPEVSTFPHHKHEGPDERVVASNQPSVRVVREEIDTYMSADA